MTSARPRLSGKRNLANNPLTREYLDVGLPLIAAQFRPDINLADDDDKWSRQSAFFDYAHGTLFAVIARTSGARRPCTGAGMAAAKWREGEWMRWSRSRPPNPAKWRVTGC